jgi:hypothetical protein
MPNAMRRSLADGGVVTGGGAVVPSTVNGFFVDCPALVAVIVTDPAATAFTAPSLSTAMTVGALLVQLTADAGTARPAASVTVKCVVSPTEYVDELATKVSVTDPDPAGAVPTGSVMNGDSQATANSSPMSADI